MQLKKVKVIKCQLRKVWRTERLWWVLPAFS